MIRYEKQDSDVDIAKMHDMKAYYDKNAGIFTVLERDLCHVMLTDDEALALAEAIIKHFKGDV